MKRTERRTEIFAYTEKLRRHQEKQILEKQEAFLIVAFLLIQSLPEGLNQSVRSIESTATLPGREEDVSSGILKESEGSGDILPKCYFRNF